MIDRGRFAEWVSDEARAAAASPYPAPPAGADLTTLRLHYDAFNRTMLDRALAAYPVECAGIGVAGVGAHTVTPRGGPTNDRKLVCLHGGAFMWGSVAGALLEAVPIAALSGSEVIAVDYRLAPEHPFPAAVDDVIAVYDAMRSATKTSAIGIYGCSAGGILTAQVVARMVLDGVPLPGAIAMLHGAGLDFEGDSAVTAAAFDPHGGTGASPRAKDLPYFAAADLADPAVMPGEHPDLLSRFPPSLLVSATRDFAASACATMHRRLLAAGAQSQFVLFDGLGHAHHMDVSLPESRETFGLVAGFFEAHLQ